VEFFVRKNTLFTAASTFNGRKPTTAQNAIIVCTSTAHL
jgi:hypothetical protein